MVKKFDKKGHKIERDDDVIALNCFDGAEAIRSEKQVKGVISFSSLILTAKLINGGHVQAGSSFNILIWLQILGKEEIKVMKPCLLQFLIDRRELFEERPKPTLLPNNKIYMYDLHDGKLLNLLTQHSMWNRRNHPFILCKCKRNNSFIHYCNMWNDKQYEEKWDLSKRKWEVMAPLPQEWNMNKHKKWSDE